MIAAVALYFMQNVHSDLPRKPKTVAIIIRARNVLAAEKGNDLFLVELGM